MGRRYGQWEGGDGASGQALVVGSDEVRRAWEMSRSAGVRVAAVWRGGAGGILGGRQLLTGGGRTILGSFWRGHGACMEGMEGRYRPFAHLVEQENHSSKTA